MAETCTSLEGQSKIQISLLSEEEAWILLQKHARIDHCSASSLLYEVARGVARECKATSEGCAIKVNVAKDHRLKANESFVSSWYVEKESEDPLPHKFDASKHEIMLIHTQSGFESSSLSFEGLKVLAIISENYGEVVLPSLPQFTHLLTNLQVLRLVGWNLGDISYLESLTELEILDLHFSRFKSLPNGIIKLNKLRMLDLTWCFVEEDYYEVVGRCSQLEELYASAIIENNGRMDSYECFLDDATFPKLQRYTLRIGELYSEYLDILYDTSRRIVHVGELDTSTIGAIMKSFLQRAEEVGLETLYGGCKSIIPEMFQAIGGMDELTVLCLRCCSEIEYLINITAFHQADSFQAMVSKLVKIELIEMISLRKVCHGTCNLYNLKTLEICGCPMLTSLFSMSVAHTLVQLQDLVITNCGELKQIIKVNEGDEGHGTSKVLDMTCLMLSKLKTLTVYNCAKLELIFPASCVESLVQLRTVQIHECSGLKYFFGHHEYDGQHFGNNTPIEFPCVELLQLIDLPNLQSLLPEKYHSRWPSLRILNCRGCPKLTTPHSELKQPHTITISYPNLIH
ncbi:hypothetical protein RJT34_11088 [Clitoria ternatea]|uniref:Disease resistance protein At4g27190-like leucine-rich repeats domain-containing protein n=1 Tax=Clitoria ternatea TaxID=43366 RepID=A0AAN9JLS3_CLITE